MPSLETEILILILKEKNKDSYINFVETGTYLGETIFNLEPFFQNLYTIEINQDDYNNVISKYTGNKINFILGDSSIELEFLSKNMNGNTVFFLDGHWSGGNTGKGKKDCPLYEEITHINNHFKYSGIIIIDDRRLFGQGPNTSGEICNWEDINDNTILSILNKRIEKIYYLPSKFDSKDRMIIEIKSLQ
jgi:hypothetical protein